MRLSDERPTEFKMVPDQSDLGAIPRDLRFHELGVAQPALLSRDQIQQFNRHGFLKGIPVFDQDEMEDIRQYFDRLLEQTLAAGGDSYSISSAHLRHRRVYDLLREPRLVDFVSDLLGENVIGWGSHFFCKMPNDGKVVTWHQDATYWPLTPSKTVTIWLAIDDADRENACMQFIPGSHHHGELTARMSESSELNVLTQTVDISEIDQEPVYVELRAGEISMHSDLLLHGSEANCSSRRRCGLTLRYCSADVRAHLGWHEKGVYVRGEDASGHWTNRMAPDEE